ncbi:MAG: heavy-metal-associated domain-containing protein [Ruminococcaceae bacterium]|nr:heavy-metal-associated domain-containing protein [Oscillospiraceae bacterium]
MLFGKKKTVKLKIEGMHCPRCAEKVENALKALGCKAEIDVKLGKATVTCPEKVTDAQLTEAVTAAGFPAVIA